MKQFLVLNNEELDQKTKRCKNDNTEKAERCADSAFKNFLITMEVPPDKTNYWNYTEPEFNTFLAKFWFGARKDI